MKKQLTKFLVVAFVIMGIMQSSFAQIVPQGIAYQAVARNASGNLVASSTVSLRFSIVDSSISGPVVYEETQSILTNTLGLFTVYIGTGTATLGTFSAINWGRASKYLKVEIDITGGTNYSNMGTTQMMSVPYAMYAGGSASSWGLKGNAGIDTINNFIGTSDDQALIFKVNKTKAGLIENSSGNTAFGITSFYSNTTGAANTAIGDAALYSNTKGSFNTACGNAALYSNALGGYNIAIGSGALELNVTGTSNTAIGTAALVSNQTGSNNSAIGNGADVATSNLTNATAVGYNAKVGASNSLVLGGTGSAAVNVGIGTSTPAYPLDIVGSINANFSAYSSCGLFNTGGASGSVNGTSITSLIGLHVAGSIWTGGAVITTSDKRTKKDFSFSNNQKDIITLAQLKVTNFRYKDEIEHGSAFKKGFIAQDVQQVFPEAVTIHTDFITDIFSLPAKTDLVNGSLIITMKNNHGLCDGDEVRLITSSGKEDVKVEVKSDSTFSVSGWKSNDTSVFVYGKKVDDFLAVDYDRIYTLNVSATQELIKKVNDLEEQNSELKALNKTLDSTKVDIKDFEQIKRQNLIMQVQIDLQNESIEELKVAFNLLHKNNCSQQTPSTASVKN